MRRAAALVGNVLLAILVNRISTYLDYWVEAGLYLLCAGIGLYLIATWEPISGRIIRYTRGYARMVVVSSFIILWFVIGSVLLYLLLRHYGPSGTAIHEDESRRLAGAAQVVLLSPTGDHHLRWVPATDFHPLMVPEPQAWESASNQPVLFGLKNLGTHPTQDLRIEWAFEGDGNTLEMILRSPYTQRFRPTIAGESITLSAGIYSLTLRLADREAQIVPYLIASPASDDVHQLPMPEYFSRAFKMRVVATQGRVLQSGMPPVPMSREAGPTVSVTVSWGPPRTRATVRYLVRSEIRVLPADVGAPGLFNIAAQHQAPENLRAYITFTAEKVD